MDGTGKPGDAVNEYLEGLRAAQPKLVAETSVLFKRFGEALGFAVKVTHAPDAPEHGWPELEIIANNHTLGYVALARGGGGKRSFTTQFARRYELLSDNLLATDGRKWVWLNRGAENANFKIDPDAPEAKAELAEMLAGFFAAANYQHAEPYELAPRLAQRAALFQRQINRALKSGQTAALARFYAEHNELQYQGLLTPRAFSFQLAEAIVWLALGGQAKRPDEPLLKNNWTRVLPRQLGFIGDFLKALERGDPEFARLFTETRELLNASPPELARTLQPEKARTNSRRDNLFGHYDPWPEFRARFKSAFRDERTARSPDLLGRPEVLSFIARLWEGLSAPGISGLDDAEQTRLLVPEGAEALPGLFARVLRDYPPKSGKRDGVIRKHLLRHFFATERDLSKLAFALLRITSFLVADNYTLLPTERIPVFLADAYRRNAEPSDGIAQGWKDEARRAARLHKAVMPFLLHNICSETRDPPLQISETWSISGKTKRARELTELGELIEGVKPAKLSRLEKKIAAFFDDPGVKAAAFFARRLEKQKQGFYCIITTPNWLAAPLGRALREALSSICGEVYLLHIDAAKPEADARAIAAKSEHLGENEDGLVLVCLAKSESNSSRRNVWERRLEGSAEAKLAWLSKAIPAETDWTELAPKAPYFSFSESTPADWRAYEQGWGIHEIFQRHFRGLKKERDYSPEEPGGATFGLFPTARVPGEYAAAPGEETRELQRFFANDKVNFSLVCNKTVAANAAGVIGLAAAPADEFFMTHQKVAWQFPLWRPSENSAEGIFAGAEVRASERRSPNFSPEFLHFWKSRYAGLPAEDAFFAALALLHSAEYLAEYRELLAADWPRVIFPEAPEELAAKARAGKILAAASTTDFVWLEALLAEGEGSLLDAWLACKDCGQLPVYEEITVRYVAYEPAKPGRPGRVRLSAEQALENVPEAAYTYQLAAFRPLPHYLNSLIGGTLTLTELERLSDMTRALAFLARLGGEK